MKCEDATSKQLHLYPLVVPQVGAHVSDAGVHLVPGVQHVSRLVLQKVPSEANPKVRNHGEGPY